MIKPFSCLLAVARLVRIALHLANGVLTLLLVYPHCQPTTRLRLKQCWSRQMLDIFGVACEVHGRVEGGLRVANHISWLDIFVINALVPSAFVAKEDVRHWPVIGWLCARTDTIFMRRDARRAARKTAGQVAACLSGGASVVIFPEGTTSDGRQVLPFFGALLQAAIDTGSPVQPVLLRYETAEGRLADSPVYCGDTSLLASMWRIASATGPARFSARVVLLPCHSAQECERRELSERLRHDIIMAMGRPDTAESLPDQRLAVSGGEGDLVRESLL